MVAEVVSKIRYESKNLGEERLRTIAQANEILEELAAQGFDVTLRQLYYQFVSRDLLPNTLRSYKNLGEAIVAGRMAGLIDWKHMVDRTRNVVEIQHWNTPAEIIEAVARSYRIDKWENQSNRILVMIEKDALAGVIEPTCNKLDVPYIACKGYMSLSEMHEIAHERLVPYENGGQQTHILHLGDHDPSGVDMTRDIQTRMATFGSSVEVHRLALNMPQIDEFNPPPNPTKLTDSRSSGYVDEFGEESWELDALSPQVIARLIEKAVLELRNNKRWRVKVEEEETQRAALTKVSDKWELVEKYVARLK
jgi:hypothetical protein